MIVVVLVGILSAIAIPNFIGMQQRAKDMQVKANMHTLQLAAEDYGVQNDGAYAHDPAQVRELLPGGGQNFKNPITKQVDLLNTGLPGSCSYADSANVKYVVTGYDHAGQKLPLELTSGQ